MREIERDRESRYMYYINIVLVNIAAMRGNHTLEWLRCGDMPSGTKPWQEHGKSMTRAVTPFNGCDV
jgi:hypothetical protein